MLEHWTEYSRFLTALVVIIDPVGVLPLFILLTARYTPRERARTVLLTVTTVVVVLIAAALLGERLLTAFGTSIASFKIGGGLVLLLMALAMLRAQPDPLRANPLEHEEAGERESVGVVPLAIPLLAGPGAISTVIIEMHRSDATLHWLVVLTIIAAVSALLWLVLRLADPIQRLLGPIGINVITRLFGLILIALAIEIMANGLRELFPILAG